MDSLIFHSIKNMGKFRDLRSRFLVSLSAVKSIFATHGRVPSAAARRTGDGEDSDGEAMELHWNEARRIYSEPIGVLRHSSSNDSLVSSLASHDLQESDDVFVDCEQEPQEPDQGQPSFGSTSYSVWEDWLIPACEISLGATLSSDERETVYSGYWHGNVHVRTRKANDLQDLSVFLDEVATLTRIRHENIQLFMGMCLDMDGGTLAVVTSELKGDSLHSRLHKYGHNFTNPSKTKLLIQIAEGMEYLHAKGIPHGLLSSECITLHHRVCISISPQVQSVRAFAASELTYLPPECVRRLHVGEGRIIVDGKPTFTADIFAFGTVVYELVTLDRPFRAVPLEVLIWRVGRGEQQSLAQVSRGKFQEVIGRCWDENPARRPSFKDVLTSIERDVLPSRFSSRLSLSLPSLLPKHGPCNSHSPVMEEPRKN